VLYERETEEVEEEWSIARISMRCVTTQLEASVFVILKENIINFCKDFVQIIFYLFIYLFLTFQ
jgi:hypothetical protein